MRKALLFLLLLLLLLLRNPIHPFINKCVFIDSKIAFTGGVGFNNMYLDFMLLYRLMYLEVLLRVNRHEAVFYLLNDRNNR